MSSRLTSKKLLNKILVKQSYLILIWLRYLSNNTSKSLGNKAPSFFVYPAISSKTTILKSPMAHKTYSQEQFSIKCYTISISFYFYTPYKINSVNNSAFYLLSILAQIPFVSTNLLILKQIKLAIPVKDNHYYSFFYFSKVL